MPFTIDLEVYQLLFATLSAATSHRGLWPLPAQVSLGFDGFRYFAAKVLRLLTPFPRACDVAP
jgi:hypothetical protein